MESQLPEPNDLIERIMEKGVRQFEIMERLGTEKGRFNSWRNSTSKRRRDEMSRRLLQLYPTELGSVVQQVNESLVPYNKDRYTRHLEETVKDLRTDIEWLRHLVDESMKRIEALLEPKK